MEQKNKTVIAGAILAGGEARRMGGIAKGTLKDHRGISIIEHLIDALKLVGICPLIIVTNDSDSYRDYGVEIIPDLKPGMGPIGGIESSLMHFADRSDAVIFVPCDLPNITSNELRLLKETFLRSNVPVVYAITENIYCHPLLSVVHNRLLEKVSEAINRDELKVRNVWRQVEAVEVQFEDESAFLNLNSMTDVKFWNEENSKKEFLHSRDIFSLYIDQLSPHTKRIREACYG
jgi:molybdopterin-guanine dinucleotide biosynthesis protein A